ncbi:hypothetical protein M0R45_000560 [Rubus argutus]|uniref:Uncharacterized protein n=1 Tax=Rubus argutus TaxID=59490 RepID=A0AAW1VMZ8_RUBAR
MLLQAAAVPSHRASITQPAPSISRRSCLRRATCAAPSIVSSPPVFSDPRPLHPPSQTRAPTAPHLQSAASLSRVEIPTVPVLLATAQPRRCGLQAIAAAVALIQTTPHISASKPVPSHVAPSPSLMP